MLTAENQCELSLKDLHNTQVETTVLQDQSADVVLAPGSSVLSVTCRLDVPSVFSFRHNSRDFTWRDIRGKSRALVSNRAAYLIPAGEYEGAITITTHENADLRLQLMSYAGFVSSSQKDNLAMGVFYGLCFSLALYVLIIGRNLRDIRFKLYSFYISCAGLFFLVQEGQLNLFFPDIVWIDSWHVSIIFAGFTVFSAVLFITRLLDMHIRWEKFTRYFLIMPAGAVLVMPFLSVMAVNHELSVLIDAVMAFSTLIIVAIVFCLVCYAAYLRVHTAGIVFFALLLVLVAMVFRVLLTETNPFLYHYGLILSFAIESFLFAIATSERIKRINENRIAAEDEAGKDVLCDVMNRRGWSAKAEQVLKLQADKGGYLCLLFIDLDRFKRVNDLHGHQVGDEVLKVTAKIIANGSRETDVVGRLGGDEFVALAHFMKLDECKMMDNRITQRLTDFAVRTSVGEITVNASVGSQIFEQSPASVSEMLRAADGAMYKQKKSSAGAHKILAD
ncbi:Signaling protein with a acyltransferase and GGDEF domains [marine gamma proteobacterium HTCC2143]|uniref:diguanylate cyclase n=1 Tax=marine gamma proteobacterium HTCC2143 TaxID=247633 RepID=A0YCW0_9GAMM|nr:Signaling protein with a acyltransferase and GGDEF domains [marine gamma proteobacterium HTCC2143]